MARIANHVAPTAERPVKPGSPAAVAAAGTPAVWFPPTEGVERAASAATPLDGRPVVVMLEAPAEDAVPLSLVEDAFAIHDLKVHWATDDFAGSPKDAIALVTVKKKVDAGILDQFPRLRLVAVAFTGYDHVDLQECRNRGVAVANVPGYSTDGVAELCFGLIFSLLRHIPVAHKHVRSGRWDWPPGNELSGKRLGLIGTGKIGMRVGEIGRAFKCSKILGYDLVRNPQFVEELGGEYASSLATLFLSADVIVVACALTKNTKGLVSEKLLKLLRPESIIINCARGAIIDQDALTRMLADGRFRAGIDVYEEEPLSVDHPLRSMPESQLVTVPHLAYKCHESLRRRQDITLANVLAFLADSPQNIVT